MDFLFNPPMTTRCGFNVSSIALPSFRNSGFVTILNPFPFFPPDDFSIICLIVLMVVPGTTVLFTTIIGFFGNTVEKCLYLLKRFLAYSNQCDQILILEYPQ